MGHATMIEHPTTARRRFATAALSLVLVGGCAHATSAGPVVLRNETVQEDKAQLGLDLSYEPKGGRRVELVLKMRVAGMIETNKLVAEVYIKGFNVEGGATRWEGFVPPRQPQTFRVLLEVAEGFEDAEARVTLSRSSDSFQLLREELTFKVDAAGAVTRQ